MENREQDVNQKILDICTQIYNTTTNMILMEMRFLDVALARLPVQPWNGDLCTDGAYLYYNPIEVMEDYKVSQAKITHDFLHVLLHCIFRHLFLTKDMMCHRDLACDIAVEQLISSLEQFHLQDEVIERKEKIDYFKKRIHPFHPYNINKFLEQQRYSDEEILELQQIFCVDKHEFWDRPIERQPLMGQGADGVGKDDLSNERQDLESVHAALRNQQDLIQKWSNVARSVEMNMECFHKKQGDLAGGLQQQLKGMNREKYDYSKFLKSFAEMYETMMVNDDEFDYIAYTYGLNTFGNMPLIEPLEYKDTLRIRDFIIAIDTSGSVSDTVVQMFLQKTYNILKSTETFQRKINLYIIQCDAEIQEVEHITDDISFEIYIAKMRIKGRGGTDFRPVFTYVEDLIAKKMFTRLKGLIYFTDGYGTFPAQKTSYETAFVFVSKEDFQNVRVPSWAMKVLLTEDEIKGVR